MLTESSRNPVAAIVEKEAGWLLLSSLLSSMPKQELEDQVFDILSLWATLFSGNPEREIQKIEDLASRICVWSAAVDALTSFVRCFISPNAANNGILLQPVMVYLSSALSYILLLQRKELPNIKPAIDIFIIRTLMAYRALPDSMAYKSDHTQIIQLCTFPFRDAARCEESSCLRLLLDKRDAWLGPWIPGRDWFEDEVCAFQGGKDGLMPCVWDNEPSSFPLPETINKMLVNQMLLCFGIMFASQDSSGMLRLLGMVEQCLKAGKKQSWHEASVTNICVGLLAGLKALIALRPQPLGPEILHGAQAIFQSILAEGDICASQRRASSEGLGLLARLGNDIFTAKMTRLLLGDLPGATDFNYAGSIAFALGCIHRSAGGMALSSLVPQTVSSISLLAKSTITGLQIWSLYGLLLTIEASGFSYVTHVQATLGLALDILLSEENGLVDFQQGVGRLINAIVAVLGPELAPGSIFFSRCKISSRQETATLLESVRFTQQLVLFAPQAVSVHTHVQTLLSTLSSGQPTLRHLAVSTLRHLIEKDPVSISDEQIEDSLFHMLNEETDSVIGSLVQATIMRLLLASCPSCPSHWILICRNMVLATLGRQDTDTNRSAGNDPSNGPDNDSGMDLGEDDENMVSGSKGMPMQGSAFGAHRINHNRDKHLRYRTRVFAAECLSHLPIAVGKNPAHFDLSLARKQYTNGGLSRDWLVLHVQELISLAYQISTIQFENMRPIGVGLLTAILDKFEKSPDPELPGHLLLEQYQAQLVSAVRTALDASSGPILLEAGLQLATKIMTSGVLGGDQVAVKRIFSLISRPLNDFKDVYYPSFAEWVSCKIKIRLLAAHASLKCYTFSFLRRHHSGVPDEYLALLPLFSKSSSILRKYWIGVLKDYSYICLCLDAKKNWNPFLDGIQSPLVSSKVQLSLEESWPVILQALALDAIPVNTHGDSKATDENTSNNSLISGYSMVELELEDYRFLWGFSLLVLFQRKHPALTRRIILSSAEVRYSGDSPTEETNTAALKQYEIVLPVFQFLLTERFFTEEYITMDICRELLQVFFYSIYMDNSWNTLSISVLSQIVQNCPADFLEAEALGYLAMELLLAYIFSVFQRTDEALSDHLHCEELISPLFIAAKILVKRCEPKKQLKSVVVALVLVAYKCIREAMTELSFSTVNDFVKCTTPLMKNLIDDSAEQGNNGSHLRAILGTCLNVIADLIKDCIKGIHLLENKRPDLLKLLQLKLSFSIEQMVLFAKLVYESQYCRQTEDSNTICLAVLKYCTKYIQTVLNDSNVQVQAIGLQVLKTMTQRSANIEDISFFTFFSGELITEIFHIIHNSLKKPASKESVAIAGECLRFLVLLQTLSKANECQRGFMNLLLKAIVMIFSASEDDSSQEVSDIRTNAVRLVSSLAQIPSSAVCFKDVLLSMPVSHKQQHQGVIRASVAQHQNASPMKTMASLEIKLPVPKDSQTSSTSTLPIEGSRQKSSPPSSPVHFDQDSMEDDQEDEDDWDAFQSFPVSTDAAEREFQDLPTSKSVNNESDMSNAELQKVISNDLGHDIKREPYNEEEEGVTSNHKNVKNSTDLNEAPGHKDEEGAVSSQENIETSPDIKVMENTEGSIQVDIMEDYAQTTHSPRNSIAHQLQVSPDDFQRVEVKEQVEENIVQSHDQLKVPPDQQNVVPGSSDALPAELLSEHETEGEAERNAC
ncbi:PROTEIN SWEETIE [Salix koriyanagi]|uniref:PROTEIN SWEETIE n=1 Tax=Salix koriyanagi TaxID=2511006 RepID=A0A9Q0ZLK4_9ROSI|nr:PROTEIN SWEETIE [Salix koriyanagi]